MGKAPAAEIPGAKKGGTLYWLEDGAMEHLSPQQAYVTDAQSAGDKVQRIALPAAAQATAVYPIGVVSGSKQTKAAQQWIDLVMSSQGQQTLTGLGFGPAPSF